MNVDAVDPRALSRCWVKVPYWNMPSPVLCFQAQHLQLDRKKRKRRFLCKVTMEAIDRVGFVNSCSIHRKSPAKPILSTNLSLNLFYR